MTDAEKIRWGIIGPGTIARTFAAGVAHSATGRLVAIGARDPGARLLPSGFPGARVARGLRGAARRPRGRGDLHRDAAPAARRVGDQGGRGRQARAGREADGALAPTRPTRSSTRHRKAGTFVGEAFMYRLHPQTARLARADPRRRDRRGPDDPVELRLRHAASSTRSTGSTPTTSPAAASSTSAATRCRWRA